MPRPLDQRGIRETSRRAIIFGAATLFVLGLAGCGGKVPATHFYTLEAALPAPPPPTAAAAPADVSVLRFGAGTQALAQDRLVYRTGLNRVGFYEYHRWVDSPADLVTHTLIERLRRAGIFRSVNVFQGSSSATFLLRGRLEDLAEVDAEDAVSARVALSVELVDPRSHSVLWSGRGAQETSVSDRSMEGIVRALNEAVNQSTDQLIRGLAAYVQQHPPAPAAAPSR